MIHHGMEQEQRRGEPGGRMNGTTRAILVLATWSIRSKILLSPSP